MKKPSWAIRVIYAGGGTAFLRRGSVVGRGPIVTFHSKAAAEREAAFLRDGMDADDVITVIERSHGRRSESPASVGAADRS